MYPNAAAPPTIARISTIPTTHPNSPLPNMETSSWVFMPGILAGDCGAVMEAGWRDCGPPLPLHPQLHRFLHPRLLRVVVVVCPAGRRLGHQRELGLQPVAEAQRVLEAQPADVHQHLPPGKFEALHGGELIV